MPSCGSKTTLPTARAQSSSCPMPESSSTSHVMKSCTSIRKSSTIIKEIMTPLRSWESKTRKDTKSSSRVSNLSSNICRSSLTSLGTTPKEPVSYSPVLRPSAKWNSYKKSSKTPHVSSSSLLLINSDPHFSKSKTDTTLMTNPKWKTPTISWEMSTLRSIWRAESLLLVQMVSVKVLYWNFWLEL